MDRLLREGNPPVGQLASPKPQYKKPGVDEYAPVEGQHGAPFATLKDASGNVVSPATEDKLEQVRQLLAGVATENKLEQARTLLDAISTKDFATSSKQDALNIAVEDLKSELILVKSELATIRENQLSGDQKVTLSGNITTATIEFHRNITAPATGTAFVVGGKNTLLVEVWGNASSRKIEFKGMGFSGVYRPIRGVRLEDFMIATEQTSNKPSLWKFSVAGLTEVVMDVTILSGGSLYVFGRAV